MKYTNPILPGFNPDPSICRVGGDYYLVTSSFEYFPGIPVYHSRDLVNWTQLGNAIDRPSQLPLDRAAVNGGIWAPTIRHHAGRFYITAKERTFGNFIISAADPAGPWTDPVPVAMGGIDPSLLFDDGRVYYCTNQRAEGESSAISMAEVDPDTGALLTRPISIWHGASDARPQYLEAPHIYHIGSWYYLIGAEGGTGFEHMITCARSRNVWGPYENCPRNPLLTSQYAPGSGVACSGHGDLIEDGRGHWWCVHLATRPDDEWYSHLGRESFLLPVTWEEEWPVISRGMGELTPEAPLWAAQQPLPAWTADLTRLQPQWLHVRTPVPENYQPVPGGLLLTPSAARLTADTDSPTLLAVRQSDIDCAVEAEMHFIPSEIGDEAGLTAFISCDGHIRFAIARDAEGTCLLISRSGVEAPLIRLPISGGDVRLRLNAVRERYTLSFAEGDGPFRTAGSVPVLTRTDAGKCFTGTLLGVYAQSTGATAARALLRSFRITPGLP